MGGRPNTLQESLKLNWNLQRGWGGGGGGRRLRQNPFCGEGWIFSGTTHYLKGKYLRNLVLYQNFQNVLLKIVVNKTIVTLRLLMSVSGQRWTGLEYTGT